MKNLPDIVSGRNFLSSAEEGNFDVSEVCRDGKRLSSAFGICQIAVSEFGACADGIVGNGAAKGAADIPELGGKAGGNGHVQGLGADISQRRAEYCLRGGNILRPDIAVVRFPP